MRSERSVFLKKFLAIIFVNECDPATMSQVVTWIIYTLERNERRATPQSWNNLERGIKVE